MNNDIFEQFETLNTEMLASVEGGGYGAQCVIGTLGSTILGGAAFGPWGASAGFFAGSTAFCYDTVS